MQLKISLVFSIVAIACLVASFTTSWYYIKAQGTFLGITLGGTFTFKWREYTRPSLTGSGRETLSYDEANLDNLGRMYRLILIFVTIGGGLQVLLLAFNLVRLLVKKMKSHIVRVVAFILSLGSIVLQSIGFFWMLNAPSSFKKDNWGLCGPEFDEFNCNDLIGSHNENGYKYTWRPDVGWWIMIGAILFSCLSLSTTMRSRRSIP